MQGAGSSSGWRTPHDHPAQTEAVACDARILEPGPGQHNRATIPPAKRQEVLARDGHRCQSPGCRHTYFLELHHLKPRAVGGDISPANLITLCSSCHRLAHEWANVGRCLQDRHVDRNPEGCVERLSDRQCHGCRVEPGGDPVNCTAGPFHPNSC
ncbi:MAG: HNH endonuclease [bacterium]